VNDYKRIKNVKKRFFTSTVLVANRFPCGQSVSYSGLCFPTTSSRSCRVQIADMSPFVSVSALGRRHMACVLTVAVLLVIMDCQIHQPAARLTQIYDGQSPEASERRWRRDARPRNVETTRARVSFRPAIFSHILTCCSLNFHSLSLYVAYI